MQRLTLPNFSRLITDLKHSPIRYTHKKEMTNISGESLVGGSNRPFLVDVPVRYETSVKKKKTSSLTVVYTEKLPENKHKGLEAGNYTYAIDLLRQKINDEKNSLGTSNIQRFLTHNNKGKYALKANCDLMDFIYEPEEYVNKFSANDFRELIAQLVQLVYAYHSVNIVHRDFKLNNIFVFIENGKVRLELSDLDGTCKFDDKKIPPLYAGLHNIPPEIKDLKQTSYDIADKKSLDCYNLGYSIKKLADLYFTFSHDKDVISENSDLITLYIQLLSNNPTKRLKIEDVMNHDYFKATTTRTAINFKELKEKYKRPDAYYDGYYQDEVASYPESGDGFFLHPRLVKDIIITANELQNQQDCLSLFAEQKDHFDYPNYLVSLKTTKIKAETLYHYTEEYLKKYKPADNMEQWNTVIELKSAVAKSIEQLENKINYWNQYSIEHVTAANLIKMIHIAVNDYILLNDLKDYTPAPNFFGWVKDKVKTHNVKGKSAALLLLKNVMALKTPSPLEVFTLIETHMRNHSGNDVTSFNIILARELESIALLPLAKWKEHSGHKGLVPR